MQKTEQREMTTSELAARLDIAPDLIRKWKARGLLPLAPGGVSGQGRGNESRWSPEAVAEVEMIADSRAPARRRRTYAED
jgi:hypothetical protein